ncbi:MAG: multiheme c-type cytochrome [Planctomycetota bacterium]|jgi:hypothetical protein
MKPPHRATAPECPSAAARFPSHPAPERPTKQRPPSSEILSPWQVLFVRLLLGGFVLLLGGGLFLMWSDGASAAATWALFLHIVGGALLLPVLLAFVLPHAIAQMRRRPVIGLTGSVMLLAALAVVYTGALLTLERAAARPPWTGSVHALVGFALVLLYALHRRFGTNRATWGRLTTGVATILLCGLAFALWERTAPAPDLAVAAAGAHEAGQPFLPSLVQTTTGGPLADSSTLTDIATCGACHPRITEDWRRSAHRHASFTNPFYKGTIEAMRAKYPLENTRWCAGCHDPALLFTGKMDRPDLDLEHDPDAMVGLTCIACHAIQPESILGNGHYTLGERRVYAWERSDDPLVIQAHDVLLKAKPDAHIQSLRPPNIDDPAFCAVCHKAEIPPEVNDW